MEKIVLTAAAIICILFFGGLIIAEIRDRRRDRRVWASMSDEEQRSCACEKAENQMKTGNEYGYKDYL